MSRPMCYQAWISLLLGLSVTVAALDLDINSTRKVPFGYFLEWR